MCRVYARHSSGFLLAAKRYLNQNPSRMQNAKKNCKPDRFVMLAVCGDYIACSRIYMNLLECVCVCCVYIVECLTNSFTIN